MVSDSSGMAYRAFTSLSEAKDTEDGIVVFRIDLRAPDQRT